MNRASRSALLTTGAVLAVLGSLLGTPAGLFRVGPDVLG